MDAELHWEDEARTVMRCTFRGDWQWKDFYAIVDQTTLFDENPHACLIVDMRAVNRIPIDAALHLKRAAQLASKIEGKVIVIATSNAALTTYQLMTRVYRPLADKLCIVGSDQEAYRLLQLGTG